jgi:hypothetical protein
MVHVSELVSDGGGHYPESFMSHGFVGKCQSVSANIGIAVTLTTAANFDNRFHCSETLTLGSPHPDISE